MNRLVLEQAANDIVEEVRSATREFEQAAERVQLRAGALVAEKVRDCVVVLRQEGAKNVGTRIAQASERNVVASRSHDGRCVQPWVVIGLLSGAALFGCGLWLGIMLQ